MALTLPLGNSAADVRAISPFLEMGAYEALWAQRGTSFKSLAAKFLDRPGSFPSDFVARSEAIGRAQNVCDRFLEADIERFGVCVFGSVEYPARLRDARHPVELLYFKGHWGLAASPSIAVVGTRKPSLEGLMVTHDVVADLVQDDFTVVSGLAAGIDRKAHETAIEHGGRTIAVLGTPLSYTYPRDNAELQRYISDRFLVISQVPLDRYEAQDYRVNRFFFPERNVTMSALTKATIITEAGESSGTLIQANAAIAQNRKLFIHEHCFRNPKLTWPDKFVELGGIRVNSYAEIRPHLSLASE